MSKSQQATDPYQRPITPRDQALALTYGLGEPLEKYIVLANHEEFLR